MANVKSRLKAPKSASTESKTKKSGKKQKSLTGPKKSKLPTKNTECDVVMKRPSNYKVMTPDEKVRFILQNGHILKEKFIIRPPANVKPKPENPPTFYTRKRDTDLPLMTRSGRLKKKNKCNMKLIDSILKDELMISDTVTTKSSSAQSFSLPQLPIGVNNNNDSATTDQNNAAEYFPHNIAEFNISGNISDDTSIDDNANFSDDSLEKVIKNTLKNDERKLEEKGFKRNSKQKHVTLSNGLVLKLAYFECDHCQKTFNRKCSLTRHMFMHLGIKPFICPRCPLEFRSRYNLQVHVKRHHKTRTEDPDLFVCNYCEKPFLVKENFDKHVATHIKSESLFKCIYCDKVFAYNILLMQHEKQHMVKGRHQCTLCSVSYRCRNRLYLHVKSHLKIKDFVCQYCGKEFLRSNSMTRHLEISHGGHRIVCPICNKNLKGHLTEHMRTHEKKRPHKCPECGQRFTQSTQLTVHRRAHTGARPYTCRICNCLFSHSNALMLHIRRHTGEKPFHCAMCPMSFSQSPHMKTHMRKIHGQENPFKCSKCDSFFKLKSQLDVHVKICIEVVKKTIKGKKKIFKKCEEEIEVDSPMALSRMRYLLALLLTMIATKEKLKYLGFNKRPIDDLLIESLEAMDKTPCKNKTLSPLKRLRKNIDMLLIGTVPKEQMEQFKKENKSTEDILELLTNEKEK